MVRREEWSTAASKPGPQAAASGALTLRRVTLHPETGAVVRVAASGARPTAGTTFLADCEEARHSIAADWPAKQEEWLV